MKILITGANGLLGSNLCSMFSKEHEVYATSRSKPNIADCTNYKLDILNKSDLKLIVTLSPDVVINCAALVNVDYCEDHPEEAENINSLGTKNIAEASRKAGSYLIHISTDAVFDGKKGDYSESDKTNPINIYGETKLSAEEHVKNISNNYVIIRTDIYGWNRKEQESLAEWMLNKLEHGDSLPAVKDVWFSPMLVNNLGDVILELCEIKYNGILNIAGSRCSKLEFAQKIAKIFHLKQDLVEPINMTDLKLKAKRARDMSLNVTNAKKLLKTKLLDVEEGLLEFKRLREDGYTNQLKKNKEKFRKMNKNKKIIAVIPAFNEEKTIDKVLFRLVEYVDDIIVVDDGSKDKTSEISKKHAMVVKNLKNIGYDASINYGFQVAQKKKPFIIITLDADGQHFPEDIPKLINPIIKGDADVMVGVRPLKARLMEYIFAWYGKKYNISDPLCGMKAYKNDVYLDIGYFDNIKSIGTQLLFTSILKGYKVKEVPIKLNRRSDTPRFGKKLSANCKLFLGLLRLIKFLNIKGKQKKPK